MQSTTHDDKRIDNHIPAAGWTAGFEAVISTADEGGALPETAAAVALATALGTRRLEARDEAALVVAVVLFDVVVEVVVVATLSSAS